MVPRPASPPLRRILVIVDALAIALGWVAALSTAIFVSGSQGPLTTAGQSILVVGLGLLRLSASGLYRRRICAIRSAEIARIARSTIALSLATVVVLSPAGRDAALLAGLVGGTAWFLALAIERGFLREWIHVRRTGGDFGAPVIVVGGGAEATARTAAFLEENPVLGFTVRGLTYQRDGSEPQSVIAPWLGPPTDLVHQARRVGAAGFVIDSRSLTGDEVSEFAREAAATGLHVHISSGLRGIDSRRITVSPAADETFLHIAPQGFTRGQTIAKRFVDVTVGTATLVVLSPVLLLAALGTWLYDRGPILYRQERVGLDGERFTLYKLRSMVVDADARLADLQDENKRSGPLFKLDRDPRVTPLGRFLRASSIDEIPQLFNVLEGTMSLVGPRPALPAEVEQFDAGLHARMSVKPGVTGLWQVEARDLPNFDLYRRFDLLYVQNWSVGLDLAIIVRTVAVVLLRGVTALLPARLKRASVLE